MINEEEKEHKFNKEKAINYNNEKGRKNGN
jgi:hypothetical protein